jgi:anti-anti-sigma regulatory factor
MPEAPSAATVSWAGNVATVTMHGVLDADSASQARERIAEVAGNRPGRLVLDLTELSERYGAECLALIAVTRQLLPRGCPLDVRSDNPAVRRVLEIASLGGSEDSARNEEPEAV